MVFAPCQWTVSPRANGSCSITCRSSCTSSAVRNASSTASRIFGATRLAWRGSRRRQVARVVLHGYAPKAQRHPKPGAPPQVLWFDSKQALKARFNTPFRAQYQPGPSRNESRFQRYHFAYYEHPGALPQADYERAPLALKRASAVGQYR